MSVHEVPSKRLDAIRFSTYTTEEIKKLSVKEISNPLFFDSLNVPVPGGLYDTALGPSDRNNICTTCLLGPLHCPGHLGHITLPLPVFNPLFYRLIVQLLHGSCLSCHNLYAPKWASQLLIIQLETLKHGRTDLVKPLKGLAAEYFEDDECSYDMVDGMEEILRNYIRETVSETSDELGEITTDRHITSIRNDLIKSFVSEHILHRPRLCRLCKANAHEVKSEHNTKLLTKEKKKDGSGLQTVAISPKEAREHLRGIFENDGTILMNLYGMFDTSQSTHGSSPPVSPVDQLFFDVIPVTPARFRPVCGVNDQKFSDMESMNMASVVRNCLTIREIVSAMNKAQKEGSTSQKRLISIMSVPGATFAEQLQIAWLDMQNHVNCIIDSDMDKLNTAKVKGVKQVLEKKEGIFRKNMMGKRVNYAARSVISPDPFINSNEIGIPDIIAKRLTYPESVTDWNVTQLRQAVKNGPNIHPGALAVENEKGQIYKLSAADPVKREAAANRLLAPSDVENMKNGQKKVHRHLRNGDVVLLNRQPTLHKPSIMAHTVRILPGEKTLRLHYSACKTYNADFDGDEMNVHFPQDEMGRAEALIIANASEQYLVPKDGTPLGGLIQDHMVAGVKMSIRGRFFNKDQYQQLVFSALTDKDGPLDLLPPSILKPALLWSGKQVISTVLKNLIPKSEKLLNFEGKAKIGPKYWTKYESRNSSFNVPQGQDMTESEVIIQNSELLVGVLDKASYGPTTYGMVHSCYELYGGEVAVKLLSCLGRLFTTFLQRFIGFTLGVEDILVVSESDKKRQKLLKKVAKCGTKVTAKALGVENHHDEEELAQAFEEAHRTERGSNLQLIDNQMKSATEQFSNEISNTCLSKGLLKKFPENNLQMMVLSGAKGSMVNCLQISCLLGQIELEGKRPPLMVSGRSLPSFRAYDPSPRAGGYVAGRFLTGIRPQEYFFHCMAGREGLVDTAVKTSRSGYLQRCIIKHLEGLVVNYDLTVRDSDSSLVQFRYGDDGVDIPHTQYLKEGLFAFLMKNAKVEEDTKAGGKLLPYQDSSKAEKCFKQIRKWKQKYGHREKGSRMSPFLEFSEGKLMPLVEQYAATEDNLTDCFKKAKDEIIQQWRNCSNKSKYAKKFQRCPDPVHCQLQPDQHLGAISEKMHHIIEGYLESQSHVFSEESPASSSWSKEKFKKMMYKKYMKSLCEPGEAVGLLAAQSIGEPSTQMTLNTFHFAGRGEMNVTLGIPRLREVLMIASQNIKTPSMDVPFLPTRKAYKKADKLKKILNKVFLADVLEDMHVWESYELGSNSDHHRVYRVRFTFLPHDNYKNSSPLSPVSTLRILEKKFYKALYYTIRRKTAYLQKASIVKSQKSRMKKSVSKDREDEAETEGAVVDMSMEEEVGEGEGAAGEKMKRQREGAEEYDDEEEQEENAEAASPEESFLESPEDATNGNIDEDAIEGSIEEDEVMESQLITERPSKKHSIGKEQKKFIIKDVCHSLSEMESYDFDEKTHLWCEFVFKLRLTNVRLDMCSLISELAHAFILHHAPGINRCIIADVDGEKRLRTDGVNLHQLYQFDDILDLNKLYTNDIHAMARTYGIEAACQVLKKEVGNVFKVYGIVVDSRHISLIADYMTNDGTYKAFNRRGLESNPSPLQKMSFESCMTFLRDATLKGTQDLLQSPSARLMVGRVVAGGTGCFDVLQPLVMS